MITGFISWGVDFIEW